MNTSTLQLPAALPPLYGLRLALHGAWRGARRAWALARARSREAAAQRERYAENERMLAELQHSRCDLPWFQQRDAFARLLEDQAAYQRCFGPGPLPPRRPPWG